MLKCSLCCTPCIKHNDLLDSCDIAKVLSFPYWHNNFRTKPTLSLSYSHSFDIHFKHLKSAGNDKVSLINPPAQKTSRQWQSAPYANSVRYFRRQDTLTMQSCRPRVLADTPSRRLSQCPAFNTRVYWCTLHTFFTSSTVTLSLGRPHLSCTDARPEAHAGTRVLTQRCADPRTFPTKTSLCSLHMFSHKNGSDVT